MNKLKILVSSYTCSPYRGSEPGVGWKFVIGLSDFHEVHVIVEKEKWEFEIREYLKENTHLNENLKFYFITKKRNKKLRKLWPPSYYWFYKIWQQEAFKLAIELNKKEKFDLAHQLTMVGFREPGYLWKLHLPFVWGPIGGLEITPWRFLPSIGLKGFIHFTGRNLINIFQKKFLSRPKSAATRDNNCLIAATPSNRDEIFKLWKKNSVVISEVGQIGHLDIELSTRKEGSIKIIWSAIHEPRKNLGLLLRALAAIDISWELHVLGEGSESAKWKKLSKKLGISDKCVWYGWIEMKESFEILKKGHLFCITSLHDLTSTVTLEALSFGLPIICLDHCGFSEVVDTTCGIKITLTTPKKVIQDFSNAIEKLYRDEKLRFQLSKGAIKRANNFSWDKKIKKLNKIYFSLLKAQKK